METLVINVDNEKDVSILMEKLKDITFIKNITWEKHVISPMLPGVPFSDKELCALLDEEEADESYGLEDVKTKLDDKFGKIWKSALGKEHI